MSLSLIEFVWKLNAKENEQDKNEAEDKEKEEKKKIRY